MKTCSRCIYNETIPEISFDEDGECSYCKLHDNMNNEYPTAKNGQKILDEMANKIKNDGKNKKYDCVIGVSGGCDSSYLLYLAKKMGLRPLAVHYDNTWDNTIAVENIHIMLKKLDIDLYTYVVDNEEFNDICRAFLQASVPEVDAATDVALTTVLYKAAEEHNIKYIFNGHSFRTEGISPIGWFYFDGKYMQSIHEKFGKMPMKTFPNLWLKKWLKWLTINRIKRLRPLYYLDYKKEEVKKFLTEEFGWKWYGGHHMENKWTIFCDNYYMPKKFNIDLRYVEFSAFIRSGQMTREEAIKKIKEPIPVEDDLIEEVKKRLGLTDEEFDNIMKAPKKVASDYKTYRSTFKLMRPFFWLMYKADLVPKSFYVKYTR
ncbi:MAG: N-acetyl sugar amidotransferase [Thermoplasmatales archaeon]|nr:N-acetyl sugar amidotransferase [Thermoplasmatales archaeon]